ncbi:MAG: DUF2070 family protein [Euryarchaeota archaeon]|nr:DUF2070 family protein [Euryarchaeota archaeon]
MTPRPDLPHEGATPQEIVEKVSELSDVLFRAPHAAWSYLLILGLPQVLLPAFFRGFDAPYLSSMLFAFLLFSVPASIAAAGAHRFARLLGGTFNRRRSCFLAASAMSFALVISIVGWYIAMYRPGFEFINGILAAHAFTAAIQVTVLFTTSDHRLLRSAQVALLQPGAGLAASAYVFAMGGRDWTIAVSLLVAFLGTTMFFLNFIDAPVRRTTGVSFSQMFRYYIDHLSRGTLAAETLFEKTQGEIDALIGVAAFRTEQGVKAAIVVPAVHPGPVGEIGGSNLPTKIIQTMGTTPNILVPHGSATHDYNPISTGEVERLGEAARRLLDEMPFTKHASPLVRAGTDAQVCAQYFGDGVLLTYTSWPRPIDDVDYGVGEAARMAAQMQGAADALFIDAHNSLVLGSGAVWPSTRRAQEIKKRAAEAARLAQQSAAMGIRAGYAQTRDAFTHFEGIGDQGCQVLVTDVAGRRTAYILWDGNNMLPDVRARIRKEIAELVHEFEVMTTDNHSVNIVTGGYNPVGYRASIDELARVTKETLVEAIDDLEDVEVGLKTTRVPDLKVFGHWNTIRFISAVQTMMATIPRAAAVLFLLQGLLTILILLVGRYL